MRGAMAPQFTWRQLAHGSLAVVAQMAATLARR